jgi:hypothetical protein
MNCKPERKRHFLRVADEIYIEGIHRAGRCDETWQEKARTGVRICRGDQGQPDN